MPAGWLVMPVPLPLLPSNWSDFSGGYSLHPMVRAGHAEGATGPAPWASAAGAASAVVLGCVSGETAEPATSAPPPAPLSVTADGSPVVGGEVAGEAGAVASPAVEVV